MSSCQSSLSWSSLGWLKTSMGAMIASFSLSLPKQWEYQGAGRRARAQ
ncbi:MAG: hypothetical protein ACJ0DF_12360 [Paracoccaceae bacterium]